MKRSVNFAHTRKLRNPLLDTAIFLKDLGMDMEGIRDVLEKMQTGKDDGPRCRWCGELLILGRCVDCDAGHNEPQKG